MKLPALPFYAFKVEVRLLKGVEFPDFMGTTLHGGLGRALMKVSQECFTRFFEPAQDNG